LKRLKILVRLEINMILASGIKKICSCTAHEICKGVEVELHSFLTSAVDGKDWSASLSGLYPKGNNHWYPLSRGPLMVAQWLSYCATNRKVAGSIPDGVIGIFH
jgi:hypothetical protein